MPHVGASWLFRWSQGGSYVSTGDDRSDRRLSTREEDLEWHVTVRPWQYLLLAVIMVPSLSSFLMRTYAFIIS